MDGGRFDDFARLISAIPRRAVLRTLAAGAVAASFAADPRPTAAACLPPGAKCAKNTLCCSGKCKKNNGQKKGRCRSCPEPFPRYCKRENRCVAADHVPCCDGGDCSSGVCCDAGFCFVECCADDECDEVCEEGLCVIV